MRINKFKRYIASLVAASMGVSLLAPQIPVWADTTSTRTIKFDLGKYSQFTGTTLPDIVTNRTGLVEVKEAMRNSSGYGNNVDNNTLIPVDTLYNLQDTKSTAGASLEMPWWNYAWIAAATGTTTADKKANSYEGQLNAYNAGTITNPPSYPTGVSWNGVPFNFPGYRLVGWTENRGVKDEAINKLPENFPYRTETTYTAHYKSDGTKFKITTKYEAGTDKAPVNDANPQTDTKMVEVERTTDDTYQTPTLNIPGYKIADNTSVVIKNTDGSTAKKNVGTSAERDATYEDYGWSMDDDKHLQGEVFNKNLEVTYTYVPDTDRNFSVDIKHIILASDGTEDKTQTERKSFHAEEPISSTGATELKTVGPRADLIEPKAGETEARYILVTENDATNPNAKAPKLTRGNTANARSHITAIEPQANGSYFDANHKLVGSMPNQNVAVTYVYKPNPNYRLNVKVSYVDTDGNSLTDKVLEEVATNPAFAYLSSGTDSRVGIDNGTIILKLNPNTNIDVPYPDLSALGYLAPTYSRTNARLDGDVTPDSANNKLTVLIQNNSFEVKVTYQKDPARLGTILFDSDSNAELEYGSPVEAERDIGGNALVITNEVAANFPTIKPSLGYEVDGYYDGDTKVANKNKEVIPNPADGSPIYELESTTNNFKLVAKVRKAAGWKDYILEYDGGEKGQMSESPKTISLYPNDADGNPRAITWADITNETNEEFAGLVPGTSAESGYEIRWYYERNNQIITSVTNSTNIIDYPSGSTFIAKAVSTAPLSVNTPSLTTEINPITGNVELKFTTINPDPRVNYVITDENGDIVKVINASDLNDLHKILSDSRITPGNNYKAYEVMPGANIGANISETPEADRSPETEITTPVAVDPSVSIDSAGNAKAVFEPITPGMSYAIIGPSGDVVLPWTDPTGTNLVIENLAPDTPYTIVAKPSTSPDSETSRMPGKNFTTVAQSTNNKIILINQADIRVEEPAGLSLDNVRAGTPVVLRANPLNAAGDTFRGANGGWELISGNVDPATIVSDGNTLYGFTMPRGNVVLRARYGSANSGTWVPATVSDAQRRPEDIGTSNPDINVAGTYRVYTERKEATPSNARALTEGANGRETFRGLFQISSKVQVYNTHTSTWEDYIPSTSIQILTSINTGALTRTNREYAIYKLEAGADPTLVYTLGDTDYENAQFSVELENGKEYIFVYSEAETYKIAIKDSRTDLSLANISIRYDAPPTALSNYSSRIVVPAVGTETIGRDGVRYIYRGLSSSATSFEEVDVNQNLRQEDTTIYAYYEDDSIQRADEENELRDLINNVNSLNSKNRIKPAIDEATEVLNKLTPRKATKEELQAAIDSLTAALNSLTPINNGGGSSGGGSGSSNTGAKSTGTSTGLNNGITWYRTYSVGTDGSWKLLDKDNHVWVFESNDGTRVVGWANLAYTYNGVRRVETYHFRADGIMDYGWFKDESGKWFYMSENHDGFFGHLIRGWYKDEKDGKWYYLSPIDGHMHTGWNSIKNVWYFLHPQNNVEPTWKYNENTHKWEYIGNASVRPLGAMYENERTPDNYFVDENGAWVEGK